ncbi:type II toxin-antitoxin system RelE/ParE family toxin [Salinarimonas ramus]|uniref:Type II toxin-antitoxin system RelE/ParE family toxin n=1 Tax=Salinarimonas ramus TaxID=690164 RepID=A0A917V3D0_9HYPH|nr:hypothetical protein GCM10011322_14740 [Salinarimonas ramus]
MTYRLRYHPAVPGDLARIEGWVSKRSSAETAARIIAEIEDAAAELTTFPHRGSVRNHVRNGIRAIPAGRRAVIVFRVNDVDRTVLIVGVSYAGSDWTRAVRSRLPPTS